MLYVVDTQYVTCPKCGQVTAYSQGASHFISCRQEIALNKLRKTIHDQFHKDSCTCDGATNKDQ